MDSTVTRLVAMRRTGRQTVASPHEPRPGNTVRTGAQGVERHGTSRKATQLPQVCALAVGRLRDTHLLRRPLVPPGVDDYPLGREDRVQFEQPLVDPAQMLQRQVAVVN